MRKNRIRTRTVQHNERDAKSDDRLFGLPEPPTHNSNISARTHLERTRVRDSRRRGKSVNIEGAEWGHNLVPARDLRGKKNNQNGSTGSQVDRR
jgi:hypothetical protein